MSEKKRIHISRRGFLIGIGAAGAAVVVGFKLGLPAMRLKIAEVLEVSEGPAGDIGAIQPTAWFEISPDNQIKLFLPKSEMGQGIHTALAQIAAEELEVDWQQLDVHHAHTAQGMDAGVTGASNSVSTLFTPLREAAAIMREVLRVEAARQLSLDPSDLAAEKGAFYGTADPERRITYGEVVQNVAEWILPEEPPALKPVSEFHTIGQPLTRVDLPAKIKGEAIYGYDMRLPGMLYGAVTRPPSYGATLESASEGQARSQPGVVTVVAEKGFAGVVAESRAQAYAGVSALEVSWQEGERWQQSQLEELVTVGNGDGIVIQKEGDPSLNLWDQSPLTTVIAEYRTPLAAHAHLEPKAALADVTPEGVSIWIATQAPYSIRGAVAEALDRDEETVTIYPTYLGSGLGSKLTVDVAIEAARLAQAAGKPVHVGWNRAEDLRYNYFRPLTHHILQAKLDDNGRIQALEHQQASGDVAFVFLPSFVAAVMGADFGSYRGAKIPYAIPHRRTVAWRVEMPIPTGWWRGLGLLANTYARESFIDEVAHAAGADPLAFRLDHLGDDEQNRRMARALEAVADSANWGGALPAGRARGVAVCEDFGTIVAQVAEVGIEEGQIKVYKVAAAVDPGLVINPDGATNQTQGAITMGLSSTLFEEITIKDGLAEATNFDRYPLLTMAEAPDIEVVLLNSGSEPFGLGEPPIGPVAAAVANAVFSLTGQRLRRLPLRL